MPRRLIDDVYDVLEESLADVIRASQTVIEHMDLLVLQSRVRALRGAVAALTAMLRDGHTWRPAEDGHEAPQWRTFVLDALRELQPGPQFLAHVTRELDELVTLATATGPRRPLPPGSFERLARKAGVRHTTCMTGPRRAGDDHAKGWAALDGYSTLARVAIALGLSPADIARTAAVLVRQRATGDAARLLELVLGGETIAPPRLQEFARSLDDEVGQAAYYAIAATERPTPMNIDSALHYVVRLEPFDVLREHLTTPAVRERLAHPEQH